VVVVLLSLFVLAHAIGQQHRLLRCTLRKGTATTPGWFDCFAIVSAGCGSAGASAGTGQAGHLIPMTIILGVIGLLVGGFLGYLIFRKDSQGGLCQPQASSGQSIGVVIVSLIWIRVGAAAEPSGADTDDGRQTEHSRVKARAGRGLPAIARGRGKRRR
jgi:hypothetical protein